MKYLKLTSIFKIEYPGWQLKSFRTQLICHIFHLKWIVGRGANAAVAGAGLDMGYFPKYLFSI